MTWSEKIWGFLICCAGSVTKDLARFRPLPLMDTPVPQKGKHLRENLVQLLTTLLYSISRIYTLPLVKQLQRKEVITPRGSRFCLSKVSLN